MSKFNWDDHPVVSESAPVKGGKFNWDDHPEVKEIEAKAPESMGRQLLRTTIDNVLPIGGAAVGGLLATPETLGFGTVPAAALGYAAGKQGARVLNNYFLGDKPAETSVGGLAKQTAGDIAEGSALEMGGQIAGKAIGKTVQAAAETKAGQKIGQLASEAGDYVASKLGKVGSKVGELFTGVPEKEIQTYVKHADEIKQMAKSSDNNTFQAAEDLRQKWSSQVDSTRKNLNKQIGDALGSSDKSVDVAPVTNALNEAKAKINSKLYPEQISQIDELVSKVKSLAEDGKLSVKDAHDVKGFLQDKASSAYNPQALFPLGTEAAKAAKSGAAVTRSLVNEAEPAVAKANNSLAHLHDIEDSMNLNMIKEGKPESAILAAGSGGNLRNEAGLADLAKATDGTMLEDAQKLSAMRTFGSPKLMAADSTGKAVGRMGLAGGIGFLAGGPVGAVAAAGLTSPFALRTAIDAGKIGAKELSYLTSSVEGKALLGKALTMEKGGAELGSLTQKMATNQAPMVIPKAASSQPIKNKQPSTQPETPPKKGEDKWASDGVDNLKQHDPNGFNLSPKQIDNLMGTRKGKELLIRASSLKPGSPAMDKVVEQIRTGFLQGDE